MQRHHPQNFSFNQGVNASSITARQMRGSSSNLVGYGLYSDPSRTSNWGNTVGTDTIAGTATGAPQNYTVYGRVPAQPTPAPDSYTDVITVTITY
jgi:spore coat protein U-like protein